jgi:thiosulfate dehydrogenase (quinone) large subunit
LALIEATEPFYRQRQKSTTGAQEDKEMSVTIEKVTHPTVGEDLAIPSAFRLPSQQHVATPKPHAAPRWAVIGLVGLRLAIGFEFLWAFFDKTFGLGYATPVARAWINGGSPTKGFLSGANGPFASVFTSIAGNPVVDWMFMLGLLGVGLALVLGVAVRAGAVSGALMLALMWLAVWVPSTTAGGQPSGSTNPFVDEHIIGIFGLIVVAGLVNWGAGYLGRRWASLHIVKTNPWLR